MTECQEGGDGEKALRQLNPGIGISGVIHLLLFTVLHFLGLLKDGGV